MTSSATSRDSATWTWLATASGSPAADWPPLFFSISGRRNTFSRPSNRTRDSDLKRGVTIWKREDAWRLPLHEHYADAIKGRYADIANAVEDRKAGSIVAAEFLRRFVGDVPWAHLDIAGTAWDTGKAYAPKGGNGYGVRLLVQLASADLT